VVSAAADPQSWLQTCSKTMPMKTKNNAVIYYLYFASQKPAALNIVNGVFKKYGQK
jgi:hypothetical protein